MAPDLNSLPPSRNMSSATASSLDSLRGQSPSPSSRSPSSSLQAAATVNAGLQQEDVVRRLSSSSSSRNSPQTGRRRSAVLMNIQLNNPNQPPPGEMVNENRTSRRGSASISPITGLGDPNHGRHASLGEIHQVMEQEEEAHVNRLLQQIRQQQMELLQIRTENARLRGEPDTGLPAIDDALTPTSESGRSQSISHAIPIPSVASSTRSPSFVHPRSSLERDMSRRSRTPSRTASPRIRTSSITGDMDPFAMAGRDEGAFYQAETQMMTRENQMLRQRIRELERQLSETHVNSAITHEPPTPSNLLRAESASDEPLSVPGTFPNDAGVATVAAGNTTGRAELPKND